MVAATEPAVRSNRLWGRLRQVGIGLLLLVGVLSAGSYVVAYWAEHQILNSDHWVTLVAPLPKQPVVSTALGNYLGQQVTSGANLQQKISEALPPQTAFLAPPLASQLNTVVSQSAQKLVASDSFQTIWVAANRAAMNRLLARARDQSPAQAKFNEQFNLNLSGASEQLRSALGSTAQALPALQSTMNSLLTVSTNLYSSAQRLHQAIRIIDFLVTALPLVFIASFLAAIAIAPKRRRTAVIGVTGIIVLMLLELIALKWLRQEVLAQVENAANLSATGYIYDAIIGSLKNIIYLVLAAMIVAEGVLLAFGPARWAQSFRSLVRIDRLRGSRAMTMYYTARQWTKQWEHYLWLGAIGLVLVVLALFSSAISTRVATNALLLAISLIALLHISATPHYHFRRRA